MNQMEFKNPVMKTGSNFTVRLGLEWAETLKPGDALHVVCPIGTLPQGQLPFEGQEKEYIGMGKVTHVISCALKDIPPIVLKNYHDEKCKNPISLMSNLQELNEVTLTDETIVSCIGFTFKPQDND